MKTFIRNYLLAGLVFTFFAGTGLLPLFSESKAGNNCLALQKDKTERESDHSGSSNETSQKEYLSDSNGIPVPERDIYSAGQKYFIANSSINTNCYTQVITPPPENG